MMILSSVLIIKMYPSIVVKIPEKNMKDFVFINSEKRFFVYFGCRNAEIPREK